MAHVIAACLYLVCRTEGTPRILGLGASRRPPLRLGCSGRGVCVGSNTWWGQPRGPASEAMGLSLALLRLQSRVLLMGSCPGAVRSEEGLPLGPAQRPPAPGLVGSQSPHLRPSVLLSVRGGSTRDRVTALQASCAAPLPRPLGLPSGWGSGFVRGLPFPSPVRVLHVGSVWPSLHSLCPVLRSSQPVGLCVALSVVGLLPSETEKLGPRVSALGGGCSPRHLLRQLCVCVQPGCGATRAGSGCSGTTWQEWGLGRTPASPRPSPKAPAQWWHLHLSGGLGA